MGLRMKNFDILGLHWKIRLLGVGGVYEKTDIEGAIVKVLTKTNQILIKCFIHFIKHDFKNACFDTTYISNVGTVYFWSFWNVCFGEKMCPTFFHF